MTRWGPLWNTSVVRHAGVLFVGDHVRSLPGTHRVAVQAETSVFQEFPGSQDTIQGATSERTCYLVPGQSLIGEARLCRYFVAVGRDVVSRHNVDAEFSWGCGD